MTRGIVFVDVDGVLNSEASFRTQVRPRVPGVFRRHRFDADTGLTSMETNPRRTNIDIGALELLNGLVLPGVEFVLSSTWRGDGGPEARAQVEADFRYLGWRGTFCDSTPQLRQHPRLERHAPSIRVDHSRGAQATRGDEITEWLAGEGLVYRVNHGRLRDGSRIAILDDDHDVDPLRDCLVPVDERVGLTRANVEHALRLLGHPVE